MLPRPLRLFVPVLLLSLAAVTTGVYGEPAFTQRMAMPEPPHRSGSDGSMPEVGSGGTIRGTARFASTGLPVAGIQVFARHQTIPGANSATTASDGTYEISTSFDGNWFVYTRDNGPDEFTIGQLYPGITCVDAGEVCDFTAGTPIPLAGGNLVTAIDFSLDIGGGIAGLYQEATTGFDANSFPTITVFDAGGGLVARLTAFYVTLRHSLGGVRTYRTDALPAGSYRVVASSSGFVDQLYDGIDCPGLGCDPTTGSLVTVTAGTMREDTDFLATIDPAQGGAFSGAAGGRNVEDTIPVSFILAWDPDTQSRIGSSVSASGSYVLAGLGATSDGTVRATAIDPGFFTELFDDIPCLDGGSPACDVAPGDPITVTAGTITPGVDFCLEDDDGLFVDGFECGDTSAWTVVVP